MKRTIAGPCMFELDPSGSICYVDIKIEIFKHTEDEEEPVGEPVMLLNYGKNRLLQKTVKLDPGEYQVYLRISATETKGSGVYQYRFLVNGIATYRGDGDVDTGPGFQRKGKSLDFLLIVKEAP